MIGLTPSIYTPNCLAHVPLEDQRVLRCVRYQPVRLYVTWHSLTSAPTLVVKGHQYTVGYHQAQHTPEGQRERVHRQERSTGAHTNLWTSPATRPATAIPDSTYQRKFAITLSCIFSRSSRRMSDSLSLATASFALSARARP